MEKRTFKKIGILGTVLMTSFAMNLYVQAEEKCETHENYYFLSEIYNLDNLNTKLEEENPYNRSHGTYFPALPDNYKDGTVKTGKVCLYSGDYNDGDQTCVEKITLDDYFKIYKRILDVASGSKQVEFEVPTDKKKTVSTYLEDGNTTYYIHGVWFEMDSSGNPMAELEGNVRVNHIDTDVLVKNSMLPSTQVSATVDENPYIRFNVVRTINKTNVAGMTGFDLKWHEEDTEERSTVLTPALYKIEYSVCGEKFEAKIDYVDEKTGDPVADSHFEDNLEDGYTNKVTSPDVEGCVIKYEDEKEVTVNIDGDNFYKKVLYVCEVEDNEKTGDVLIIAAWIVGIAALGYSVYYFTKLKKESN